MPADFTVVFSDRQHFGSTNGYFGEGTIFEDMLLQAGLNFAGPEHQYSFTTPDVSATAEALLLFESFDITLSHNLLTINGSPIANALGVCPRRDEWKNHLLVVPAGLLTGIGENSLTIESRDEFGGTESNRDNMIIANLVVMYKTS